MTAPTPANSPSREGRTALEDCLGQWLNGNHQAELEHHRTRNEDIRRSSRAHLDSAIQYYNQWNSLHYQIGNLMTDIDILVELSDMDDPIRRIMQHLRDNMDIARRVAISENNREIIDLTTDEDSDIEEIE